MFHYLIAAGLILMAMPLSGANLLENASLLWSGVGHGGAKGAVTGKSTGFRSVSYTHLTLPTILLV